MNGALSSLRTTEKQGLALFATHGIGDATTTVLAAATFGPATEANPFIRTALEQGYGFAAGIMLAVVGAVAVMYPTLAEIGDFPEWFGWALVALGGLVTAGNVGVLVA